MRSASTLPLSSKLLPALCGLLLISAAVQGLSARPDLIEPLSALLGGLLGVAFFVLGALACGEKLRCLSPEQRQALLKEKWDRWAGRVYPDPAPDPGLDDTDHLDEQRADIKRLATRVTVHLLDAQTMDDIRGVHVPPTLAPTRPTDPGRH
jgi:hypothetical protein